MAISVATKGKEDATGSFHPEIDEAMNYLLEAQPDTTISLLQNLEKRSWDKLSPREKYRLKANIGHAFKQKNQIAEAANHYLLAHSFLPDDAKALALAAQGYHFLGDAENAEKKMQLALSKEPNEPDVIVAWLVLQPEDMDFSSIEKDVPLNTKSNGYVACLLSDFAITSLIFPTKSGQ